MSEKREKIKVGITHGDVNGVGYEVILKAFTDNKMLDLCTPVIYGSKKYSTVHKSQLKMENFPFFFIESSDDAKKNKVNLIDCCEDQEDLNLGEPTISSGKAAYQSLEKAVSDLRNNKIDVVVTAPINKKNIQGENFDFPGHTEFLSQQDAGNKGLMFMISEKLKIGVVTGHIPLKDVSQAISTEEIEEKLTIMNQSLIRDFNIRKPKIAVLGLNPHSGDNGLLGTEEQDVIIKSIQNACQKNIIAHGPFPADGFFGSSQYSNYDGVLAMYHDQGLIPFKALSFGEGVNFTAGLSFVRTSPDHGTGYDIAGENKADSSSMRKAIYTAIEICKNRHFNDGLQKNAIRSQSGREKGPGASSQQRNNRGERKSQNKPASNVSE
ncbi:MAG: 4-hydroxythreonine-4-phosphate dehydrogenase PdxA [Flavobacteriales bacterium]|nr:4-hydroxythreonine-4-phosphate dehydrogenase PdxA [Flavobacteriales bacterium]|tara:strand:+ start:1460 stop:2599 length:1140 start_codon:yes stop_codon:yes gene_type:complete